MPRSIARARSQRGSQGRFRGGNRNPNLRNMPEQLKPYNADPINVRKFRYIYTGSAGTVSITRANIVALWTVGTVNNSAVTSCFAAARVRSVMVRTAGVTSGGNLTLGYSSSSITWVSENAPDSEVSVTGNPDHPGAMKSSPPVGSLASYWSNYNSSDLTTTLFNLSLNPNDIVEVVVEWTPANSTETLGVTVVNAAVGNFYYLALDGVSTHSLTPVSNPTTH
jgi:hypothetical protein